MYYHMFHKLICGQVGFERRLSVICSYVRLVVRSAVTGPNSSRVLSTSTLKYHAADKHDTPPMQSL